MKEMQTNWIGKSSGAEIDFAIANTTHKIRVYTTRPDTLFGVDFMVLAPEHELAAQLASAEQAKSVEEYISWVKSRSERERMAEKKSVVFLQAPMLFIHLIPTEKFRFGWLNMFWQGMELAQ